jgi:hypothetical protein
MLTERKVLELIRQARKAQEDRTPKLTLKVPRSEAATGSPSIQEAFARLRSDPLLYATVKLRQMRVKQLRDLLKDPAAIDLDTFNREVWQVGNSLSFAGEVVTPWSLQREEDYQLVDAVWLKEFEQAVKDETLEFHGNSIWGSGARIYGTRLPKASAAKKI